MSDSMSQLLAAVADPTRRDLVARLTDGDATVGHRSPVHPEAEVSDLMTRWIGRYPQRAEAR